MMSGCDLYSVCIWVMESRLKNSQFCTIFLLLLNGVPLIRPTTWTRSPWWSYLRVQTMYIHI